MRKYFYELNYHYIDKNNDDHYFLIGYFSTLQKANLAIKEVQNQPGFKDHDGAFEIEKFSVNFEKDIIEKSGLILYELSHEFLDSDGYDNFIIFGLYSTYEEAKKAQTKKEKEHPYAEMKEGFLIAESEVDLCGWTEGFKSW